VVIPAITHQGIVVTIAVNVIVAVPAADLILAFTAMDTVVPAVAVDGIRTVVSVNRIVAVIAVEPVSAVTAPDHVIARAPIDNIRTVTTTDYIGPTGSIQIIVTPQTADGLILGCAGVIIISTGARETRQELLGSSRLEGYNEQDQQG
jgi:hypothetical protein